MKRALILVLIFFAINSYAQITPPGPINLCAGGSQILTAPAGTTYQWIKNGANLPGQTSQTYNATTAGNYAVTVDGVTSAIVVVNVNPNPAIPNFTATYTALQCSEIPVSFNVVSPVGGITYTWNFGDGNTATGTSATHTYNALGNGTQGFNATVTATNSFNCSVTSAAQTITLTQHPDASIADYQSQTPFTNCGTPTFDLIIDNISTTQPTNSQYQINWGDGSPLFTSPTLPTTGTQHIYLTQGYFYLVLKVTGQNGCISTKTYTVFNGSNPGVTIGSHGGTVLQCLPAVDSFFISDVTSNPPGTTYTISFNDGSPNIVYSHPPPAFFLHTFTTSSCSAVNPTNPNSFYVKIRAENPCGFLDGGVEPITTITRPSAAIGISPDTVDCINTTVYFTNTSSNGQVVLNGVCNSGSIINWIIAPITGSLTGWTVTSGTIGSPNPTTNSATWGSSTIGVDFNTIGTYSIKIIVRNFSAVGTTCRMDSITRIVCISTLPNAGFKLNKNKGCLPLNVNATDTSTFLNNCRALSYLWAVTYAPDNCGIDSSWSFTGGTTDTSKNPKFVFKKAGRYTIEQTVISPCGNLVSTKDVNVFRSPTLSLPPDTTSCGPTNYDPWVILPGCDTLTISYAWTFDGVPSTSSLPDPNPVLFTGVGSHPITLIASNACGVAKDTQLVIIKDIPDVIPHGDTTICPGTTLGPIVFASTATGAIFNWTNSNPAIGLGASGTGDIPQFITTNITSQPDTGIVIVSSLIPNCGTSLPDTFLIIVKPTITDTTRDTICNNQLPYNWRGNSYSLAGTFTVNVNNTTGCDTLATLILDVIIPIPSFTNVTICPAQIPYLWNGANYNTSGNHTITLLTLAGCDSSATLNLTISDTIISQQYTSICTKDTPYIWNGRTYTTTTTDSIHLKNSVNCDSIAYLTLTVNLPSSSTSNIPVCKNQLPFQWNGNQYSTSGTYLYTTTNYLKCDSIATLNLTVVDTSGSLTIVPVCPPQIPYNWNGSNYSTSGVYQFITPNYLGCDSFARLQLIVKDTSSSFTKISVCRNKFPFSWNGQNFNGPGTYTVILPNHVGCDSFLTLKLLKIDTSRSDTNVFVCQNKLPYTWNNIPYNAAGDYSIRFNGGNIKGCDSVAYLHLKVKDTSATPLSIAICPTQLPFSWNGIICNSGGQYTKTFPNNVGCDSVVTLTLVIKDTTSSMKVVAVCSNHLPYLWNGTPYFNSGVYQFVDSNSVGCDSFARLQLIVKPTSTSTTNISVCREDLPYSWNGSSYSLAGTYIKTFQNSVQCDSFATLNLSIKQGTTNTTIIKICKSQTPFVWNLKAYNSSTIDSIKLQGINNCDSISRLELTVYNDNTSTTDTSVCQGDYPFRWNGSTFDSAGIYTIHLNTYQNCDSAAKLILHTKLISRKTITASVCANKFPYTWNTHSYFAAGVYHDTLSNAAGCDSITTLVLNIKQPTRSLTQVSICPSQLPYKWNTRTYNAATSDSITLVNAVGCDSVAVLVLTVRTSDSSTTNASVCSNKFPYSWNGNNYNAAGTYQVSFTNTQGCDSIAILVLKKIDTTTGKVDTAVCRNNLPFVWHGNAYPLAGGYKIKLVNLAGCDSVVTLNLTVKDTSVSLTDSGVCQSALPITWNGNVYNLPGDYTKVLINHNGCDSFAHLHLHIKPNTSSVTVKNICPSALPFTWNGHLYNTGGIYLDTLPNSVGCDSVAKLVLNIKDTSLSVSTVSICPRQIPYLWNGLLLSTSGTYTKSLINTIGCDSTAMLILTAKRDTGSLTVIKICPSQLPFSWNGKIYTAAAKDSVVFNAVNGCDSIARLDLIIKDTTKSTSNISICQNDFPFFWNNNTYNLPGIYSVLLAGANVNHCDSVAKLILRSKPISRSTTTVGVCTGQFPYIWHGKPYNNAGVFYDTLNNANAVGCDSICKLVINATSPTSSVTQLAICSNLLPYSWNNIICPTPGIYHDTIPNSAGCDSAMTLYLTTKPVGISNTTITICPLQLPYTWNGVVFNTAGNDTVIIPNPPGCDSFAILHLLVKPALRDTVHVKTCSNQVPYFWHGNFYFISGYYSDTTQNMAGCDSISTLHLTVNPTSSSSDTQAVCKNHLPFIWNGNVYNSTGIYNATLSNVFGCDSVVTLHLKVYNIDTTTVYDNVCQSQLPYLWNSGVYNAAGTYYKTLTANNTCDSVAKLILTVTPNPPLPVANSNSPVCEGTALTLTCSTIAGANYSWSGPGAFLSTTQNPVKNNVSTAAAGNYIVTVNVNGCSSSDIEPVAIIPKSIGGNTNSDSTVCSGANTGTIYLTGNTGNVVRWEYSINNGASWPPIVNTSSAYTYNNLTANTGYRAVVQTGNCPLVFSDTTKITIIPNASVANAGIDQKLCNLSSTVLAANNPVVGTGKWSQFAGPTTAVFSNATLYNTTVTGMQTNSTYKFVWTITSPGNCNNTSDTVTIIIRPKITTANAGPDQTVCDFPNTTSVIMAANQDPTRPFENGLWSLLLQPPFSTVTIVNPSSPSSLFLFNKPGTYKLIWTIGNDAFSCPATKDTVVINVYDKPVAAFRASPSQFCLGQQDTVFNSSLNANAYEWSWGDGTTSTFTSGQHFYQSAGNFTIALVAKFVDALATCTDTTRRQVVVVNKVRAQMNVAAGKPCVPYTLVANAVNTAGAASIQWKIFDHSILPGIFYATGTTASHTYNFAGSDSVRLIVYSTNGCADSTTYKFTVYDVPVTVAQPLNIIKTCSHDTTIKFTANTSYPGADPLSYQWYIDSSVAGNVNPFIHRFITPLDSPNTVTYTIAVLAENSGRCGDTSFQGSVVILPLPPISIKVNPSLIQQQPDYTFNFADTSVYDSLMLYQWNMGDKNLQTRDGKTVSYAYSDTGKFKVRLLKTNLATGCQANDSVKVTILPVPGYLQIPNAICPGCSEYALRRFLPLGKGLKEYHLRIYNKWGQKIFETSALNPDGSPKEAWDGRWAIDHATGSLLQQDAYTWQAEGLYINGTEWKGMIYPESTHPVKTGFITIIR